MHYSRTGFCLAVFFTASLSTALSATLEKAKASVLAMGVTLDGDSRPDLGRAMTDAFSAAMLKKGNYRIFSHDTAPKPTRPGKGKKGDLMLGAIPLDAYGKVPAMPQLDYLFTFNLIGAKDRYALTVKKIDAHTQEVLQAHELATTGSLERVFALVPEALEKLDARKATMPFPRTQSPSEVRAAQPATKQSIAVSTTPRNPGTAGGVPMEYAEENLKTVPKALVYRRVGSVVTSNTPWKFAIVQPADGKNLGVSDTVQVLWDDSGKTYSELKVSNYEQGKVITDFGHNAAHKPLFSGDAVYGWAEPLW
jgi:hypothetical protein